MGASQLAPHPDDCHGLECVPAAVEHDASAHRFGTADTDDAAHRLHCLVCDWIRGFRPRAEVAFQQAPAQTAGVHTHADVVLVAFATLAAQPSLRAPPVPPVFA